MAPSGKIWAQGLRGSPPQTELVHYSIDISYKFLPEDTVAVT